MDQSTLIVARIAEHVEPIVRGERYEDPLDAQLRATGLGEVTGGGTAFSHDGGIAFGDIDIEVTDIAASIPLITDVLSRQGAAIGSYLQYHQEQTAITIPFGVMECTALFLDGVGLPQAIYDATDINELAHQLETALDRTQTGEIRGSWAGKSETSLLMYGPSADAIAQAIAPVIQSYPLCHNSRLIVRYRHPEGPLREERTVSLT